MIRQRIRGKRLKPILFIFTFLSCALLGAQETAFVYFDKISSYYGSIQDYIAEVEITEGDKIQSATIQYKTPNLLHMEFSNPRGVVLNSNNGELLLYVPQHSVTFIQELRRHSTGSLAGMASSQGLNLLKKNYTIAYLTGPEPQPLDDETPDLVVKLRLNWKTSNEGFREMVLSIGSNNLIRRIEAVTTQHEQIQFDFFDIKINQNLPESIFDYEAPPQGNAIENFLFDPEE